jgi:hypothetical protein
MLSVKPAPTDDRVALSASINAKNRVGSANTKVRYATLPFGNAWRTGTLRERSLHDGGVAQLKLWNRLGS